jgi:hypothetical protein
LQVVVAVPLGKSGKEQEVAQSGQKEEGEMEKTVGNEKDALRMIWSVNCR